MQLIVLLVSYFGPIDGEGEAPYLCSAHSGGEDVALVVDSDRALKKV